MVPEEEEGDEEGDSEGVAAEGVDDAEAGAEAALKFGERCEKKRMSRAALNANAAGVVEEWRVRTLDEGVGRAMGGERHTVGVEEDEREEQDERVRLVVCMVRARTAALVMD